MAKKFILLHVLLAVMVVCGMTGQMVHAQTTILKLDINANDTEAETEPGFASWVITDNGSDVNGVTIQINGTVDSRRRATPTGVEYEQIYRDFIFSRPGGMTVTLSGLEVNAAYEITIYAFDTGSAAGGDRIADWLANGEFCLTAGFNAGFLPTHADDYASTGSAMSDENGVIVLECTANENTTELTGATNPFGFLNALIVTTTAVLTKARAPEPADGSLYPDVEVTLGWISGGYAVSNNLYFGDNFDDVNNATPEDADVFLGSIQGNSYSIIVDMPPFPDGLTRGTTYYWRVDGINDSNPDSPWKGKVWSFTVQPKIAFNPSPVDTSLFADPNLTLVWDPGANSTEHHVYFGDNPEDVQAGTGDTDKGVTTEPNYTPGILELNTTYYWRVDEFDGRSTNVGDVWSFTTTLPDLGTIVFDMWTNISGSTLDLLRDSPRYPDNPNQSELITSFDVGVGVEQSYADNYGAKIYGWLYVPLTGDYTFYFTSADEGELYLSTDDDPANVVLLAHQLTWGQYGAFVLWSDPIPLVGGERYYIEAVWKEAGDWDHCQVAWQGTGIRDLEIIGGSYLSPYAPLTAYSPVPNNGSVDQMVNPEFSWKPGKFAASHVISLGTDPNALSQVGTKPLGDESYVSSSQLLFNQTYYWRIDEVNDLEPNSPWIGKTWSFTTGNYLVVEDFEDYNDYPPNEVWNVWLDGYDDPLNGSTAGYGDPDFVAGEHYLEDANIHGGEWSMPVFYDNSAAPLSEVTRTFSSADRNWNRDDVVTLTLFYCSGDPNNILEPMYVVIDGVVVVNEDPNAAINTTWTRWDIPLQLLADQGVNLNNVRSMTIGFGNKANPTAGGGSGFVFFDDIRLYREE
jgi:hypothetical protein